ncbi:TIGR03086 family metal-binding protein [Mycobacterium talmoniae]|uniref:TIGR03086 family protein n=1 Tax=Mycobacterium talmoniae TaxID=1858794 RepID=A0A1S1NLS0_9MYCO|nr:MULTISPECIES: TIGR03086 family metal-binding protein [Mycobacterium]OHV05577.1 TIGR03086 family protein [Mycobacterium talmoniae]TDH55477.1 TIGR03086 family protein [Mycobacterium eburneum]
MNINEGIAADLRPLHRIAVQASVDAVKRVSRDDLARPTPCAGWDLADLLAHMTVQHHGFAAAARGRGPELAVWDVAAVAGAVRDDPVGVYAAAATEVLDAFAADGVLDAPFALPELAADAVFPGALAIGFHFVDYVVHGWDVARSIGAPFELPAEVVAAAVPLVFAIPDGEFRAMDNAPFGLAQPVSGAATDYERILAHLGRSPQWSLASR